LGDVGMLLLPARESAKIGDPLIRAAGTNNSKKKKERVRWEPSFDGWQWKKRSAGKREGKAIDARAKRNLVLIAGYIWAGVALVGRACGEVQRSSPAGPNGAAGVFLVYVGTSSYLLVDLAQNAARKIGRISRLAPVRIHEIVGIRQRMFVLLLRPVV